MTVEGRGKSDNQVCSLSNMMNTVEHELPVTQRSAEPWQQPNDDERETPVPKPLGGTTRGPRGPDRL